MEKAREDHIPVACIDCSECGEENVIGRASQTRTEYTGAVQITITCRHCGEMFTALRYELKIRRKPREEVEGTYGLSELPWL